MSDTDLWRIEELLQATGGTLSGEVDRCGGVSIDTRTLATGDMFVALKGDNRDGHQFVDAAFAAGAGLALVDRVVDAVDGPQLVVDDTLRALEEIGKSARARTQARIIAVTGSVGKTGTKEALFAALGASGRSHASAASYNNHWGVPLSLARMPAQTEFGIFEVGMNHPGEIRPLSGMIRPHIVIITTVAPVHLGFFENVEQIAEAKAEIFDGVEPGGTAILNRDNEHFDHLVGRAREAGIEDIVAFGSHGDAQARLLDLALKQTSSSVSADILGERVTYRIGAPGRHYVMNSLAVLAAVARAGGDLALAALELAGIEPPAGRGRQQEFDVPGGRVLVIDEAYNANPASMAAALAVLSSLEGAQAKRKIAVLGDMLELGDSAPALHAELARPIEQGNIDLVLACGPNMAHLWDRLPDSRRVAYGAAPADIEQSLLDVVQPGDAVMIKGSLGSNMKHLLDALVTALAEG